MKKQITDFLKNKLNVAIVIALFLLVIFYFLIALWSGFNAFFILLAALNCFLFAAKLIEKSKYLSNKSSLNQPKNTKREILFFAVLLIILGGYMIFALISGLI
mgnify:CR=1 FL=1